MNSSATTYGVALLFTSNAKPFKNPSLAAGDSFFYTKFFVM